MKDFFFTFAGIAVSFAVLRLMGFGFFLSGLLTLAIGRYVVYFLICLTGYLIDEMRFQRSLHRSAGLPGQPTP